jgi:hypothetical protein
MINQLLLSKRLYIIGANYVEAPDPISAGMAISLFQDSIEILCWSVLKDLDASVKENTPFTSFFDLVEKAPKNLESKKLPFKAKILELNKARVNFKHYGNLPDISEANKFKGYAEEFLRVSFNDFFNADFDSISLSQLIPFADVRVSVESAEKALSANNMKEAACELAKGKTQLFNKFSRFLPEVDRNLKDADRILGKGANISGVRVFSYLSEYLNTLRNINFVALCGVSIREYLLMEKALPRAYQTMDEKWHYTFLSSVPPVDDANKIINIIINLSLKLGQLIS